MASLNIIKGDITRIKVDAIVNAANEKLAGGGGVDGAIHRAAGMKQLNAACRPLHGCPTGQAKTTSGFKLPAKYIIHTVGPVWHGGCHHESQLLANCYRNSLNQAVKHRCRTVAFPSISTGVYHYPVDQAAQIAVRTVKNYPQPLKVTMVCFDDQTYRAYLAADR